MPDDDPGLNPVRRALTLPPLAYRRSSSSDGRASGVTRRADEVGLATWMRKLFSPEAGDLATAAEVATPGPATSTALAGPTRLRVGVVSTVGRYREHNEDNFYVPGLPPVRHDGRKDVDFDVPSVLELGSLLIVADGMGGQLAGEEASSMAVSLIPRELAKRLVDDSFDQPQTSRAIKEAVAVTNQEILAQSHIGAEYSNMGTTVVLAQFRRDHVYVAGIGDSRAYRLRDRKLEQLTKDHSLADALGEAGTISRSEVPFHKFKNVLYLYLGSKDARGGPEEVRVLPIVAGDRFLMASDGLTGVVEDADIAMILCDNDDPQLASRLLMERALANNSKDNVTCLVVHVE
jgi:serine/threonine protein phosphatase PrpC